MTKTLTPASDEALVERLRDKRFDGRWFDRRKAADHIETQSQLIADLRRAVERKEAALSATLGYCRNVRIDLETGCTKAAAIKRLDDMNAYVSAALTPKQQGETK